MFAYFAKGNAGGDSVLLKVVAQPPWKQSVATPQFLFSYPGGKTGFYTGTDSPAKPLTHTVRSLV